jgi:WD40 repeat protein
LLEIQRARKRPFSRKITIQSGNPNLIRAPLADYTGTLEILTTPAAELLVDGKPAGIADAVGRLVIKDLVASDHSVRVGRPGYNSQERNVWISPDVTTTLTMELAAIETIPEEQTPPPNFVLSRVLAGHPGNTVMSVFGADSLQLISWTLGGGGLLKSWEPASGREMSSLQMQSTHVLAVSPDLQLLLVTGMSAQVTDAVIVDTGTGKGILRLPVRSKVSDAVFSPDAKRLLIGIGRTFFSDAEGFAVWDVLKGKELHSWSEPSFRALGWSPNGKWLATAIEQRGAIRDAVTSIVIWDAGTWKETRRFGSDESAPELVFSPNSRWLAVVDDHVTVWDVGTGKRGRTIDSPGTSSFGSVQFTADSRFVAAIMGGGVRLWEISSGAEVRRWPTSAMTLAFSPDGRWMATGSSGGGLSIWRRID